MDKSEKLKKKIKKMTKKQEYNKLKDTDKKSIKYKLLKYRLKEIKKEETKIRNIKTLDKECINLVDDLISTNLKKKYNNKIKYENRNGNINSDYNKSETELLSLEKDDINNNLNFRLENEMMLNVNNSESFVPPYSYGSGNKYASYSS